MLSKALGKINLGKDAIKGLLFLKAHFELFGNFTIKSSCLWNFDWFNNIFSQINYKFITRDHQPTTTTTHSKIVCCAL